MRELRFEISIVSRYSRGGSAVFLGEEKKEGQEGKKGDTTYRYGVRNFCHGNDKLYPGEQWLTDGCDGRI